ncbi:MAG: hypothetical protein P0S94_01945 [Simkaniaceae bacterium]|nr:hypothetical protein [Simkaniaceae bacterium]
MKKLAYLLTLTSTIFATVTGWQTPSIINSSVSGTPTGFGLNIDASGNGVVLFGTNTPSLNASAGTIITDIDAGTTLSAPCGIGISGTASFTALWLDTSDVLHTRPFTFAGTLGERTQLATGVSGNPAAFPQIHSTPAGNMYAVFSPSAENALLARYYTASTDTWASQFPIVSDNINGTAFTVNAGNILLATWVNDGNSLRAVFFDGSTEQGSEKGITNSVDTNSSPSVAAQVKTTDTGGLFLAAYKHTDGGAYANVHSETLTDEWEGEEKLSGVGETVVDGQISCVMSPAGNGLVAWRVDDNTLRAAIYLASIGEFSATSTLVEGVDTIGGLASGSDGTFTITYDTTENSVKVHKSITITPPSTVASPLTIWTATSTNVSGPLLAINPRGTVGVSAWIDNGTSIYKTISIGTGNHGASSGNLFRKGKNALRLKSKPYR